MTVPTLCYSQSLPKHALCILYEGNFDVTYLTSLSYKKYKGIIENDGYVLSYSMATYSKESKLIAGSSGFEMQVIPEDNNRFRFETIMAYSAFYVDGVETGHGHGLSWNFACYSDDDCTEAKVFKYFHEHREKYESEGNKRDSIDNCYRGELHEFVEQEPEFGVGENDLQRYIHSHIVYPTEAKEQGICGTVIVELIINKDGSICHARVARGIHPLIDKEALRVINSLPKWTPAILYDEPVKVRYGVPVRFECQE